MERMEYSQSSDGLGLIVRCNGTSVMYVPNLIRRLAPVSDGEGNEEATQNMAEVDRNLDQMSSMMSGLNTMAQVCGLVCASAEGLAKREK
jgi:hypothetical protein